MAVNICFLPRSKSIIRKLPFVVLPLRICRSILFFALKVISKTVYWKPFLSSGYVRSAFFDSARPNTLLLSSVGTEKYLVSSSDKVIGRQAFVGGGYDFEKVEKVFTILDGQFEPDLLIDIGANIGTICIPAVKRGLFDRAIAFEPEPLNFALLSSNININGLSARITAHNMALGEREGEEIEFELSQDNYGDHRICISKVNGANDEINRKTIRVKCAPLDKVLHDITPSKTLIWMDTQGFEGFVLKGAIETLNNRPPMVIEFWPYGMNRSGSYEMLKKVICHAGYKTFYDLNEDRSSSPISEEAFDELFNRLGAGGRFTDLLIV